MALLAFLISLFIAALGALGVASPSRLVNVVRSFETPAGLYFAAFLRIVFGVALFLTAPASRGPGLIRALGVIVFLAGLVTPLVGLERFRSLLDWWSARGPAFIRAWGTVALSLGLLLAFAVAP
jgi:hypothetical protein